MFRSLLIASLALLGAAPVAAAPPAQTVLRPDQVAFRDLYKELIETNTTLSSGSCTLAAERLAVRLKAAGTPIGRWRWWSRPVSPSRAPWWRPSPGRTRG